MDVITMGQSTTIFGVLGHFQHGDKQPHNPSASLDKASRPSISIVIWILSSDPIYQLNQLFSNSEAAMLSMSLVSI